MQIFDIIKQTFRGRLQRPLATIAINYKPVAGPWGGASVFIRQLVDQLERCSIRVRFDLKQPVDMIFIVDPRSDLQKTAFGLEEIRYYRTRYPAVKIIHRINECDERKATSFMDAILEEANSLADHTVFISEWLKEYFEKRWFDPMRANSVIYNGADERYFHPVGGARWDGKEDFRLVTHHWSDNPMKGFPVYKMVDDWIADGKLPGLELRIIGRWPKDISWRSAKTFGPAADQALGDQLRQCHLYLTASLFEPCGMHHVEGAQCGLPLLSHVDGGGIVEAARKYGMLYQDDLLEVIRVAKENYGDLRKKVFDDMPSGGQMVNRYVRVIQRVLAEV